MQSVSPSSRHREPVLQANEALQIQTNSFDRNDGDTGDTGTFLDTTLSMVNHSCTPTALVAFSGRRAYLRAVAPVDQGDEVTISYIGESTRPTANLDRGQIAS